MTTSNQVSDDGTIQKSSSVLVAVHAHLRRNEYTVFGFNGWTCLTRQKPLLDAHGVAHNLQYGIRTRASSQCPFRLLLHTRDGVNRPEHSIPLNLITHVCVDEEGHRSSGILTSFKKCETTIWQISFTIPSEVVKNASS
ncbi:hypothetical protein PUNSTDRAFT_43540 [Punctularia strigosozonata HHB-11173 SS5]|uniref:uncharacterized protein n=1 Tax=Punctularia strigosozonata (strain HHB-11173) TaxID=741275 RepID=UPI0004417987|nr:uncharacterized protein PUNSTDRAFT_43540 [Punctularia strigosozonata HHB-11173 SS5]EIN10732.1 hypothetical protein PUNSTDRAFT_43540 [Punctularia strigosozonata HHB-11173 SS5]